VRRIRNTQTPDDLTPGIKGYNFNPDDFDDSKDPFGLGGSKLQNSPPANRHGPVSAGTGRAEAGEGSERADPRGLALKLEFDFSDDKENAENRKPQPKKAGRKNSGKSAGKKLKPGASKAGVSERKDDTSVSANSLEDPPSTNSCDANQWDNPNFNPFGGTPKLQNSPTLPKASYNFEPDSFDDSIDPFKPSKVLVNETQPTAALEVSPMYPFTYPRCRVSPTSTQSLHFAVCAVSNAGIIIIIIIIINYDKTQERDVAKNATAEELGGAKPCVFPAEVVFTVPLASLTKNRSKV
uniref:Uncharacterized protein n=1 Tax=Callorhinchus milii TaxID=7868 RepID=A0A4W3HDL6_CALMI